MTLSSDLPRRPIWPILPAVILAVELLLISLLYQHEFHFVCRATAPAWFCAFAGRIVPRALGVLALLALYIVAQRTAPKVSPAASAVSDQPAPFFVALAVNLFGFALVLLPWFFLTDANAALWILPAIGMWSLGGVLTAAGLALMMYPPRVWARLLQGRGLTLTLMIGIGLALPELADLLQPIWRITWLTETTFMSVVALLAVLGYSVETLPAEKVIGTTDFAVAVGPQCSGIEGFLLVTVFVTLTLILLRRELRFPRALLLYPIGLVASGLFNILRITVLIVIGLEGNPELAIGGFHSHAGWLSFTLLSLLLVLMARMVPWFGVPRTRQASALTPFLQDPTVLRILPFVVFMLSALVASTLSQTPALLYPWRALAMALVLLVFWQGLRRLPWRLDPVAIAAGGLIGLMWIVTAPATGFSAQSELVGIALVIWTVARLIGTTVFVPVIEELFFRDYLLSRIAPQGRGWRLLLAVAISTLCFAALHDRWFLAAIAGLIFCFVALRAGRITDAILAHGIANGTIALWALATGAWHIL